MSFTDEQIREIIRDTVSKLMNDDSSLRSVKRKRLCETAEEAIEAARAAYESLTDAQKAKVPADKLQKLVDDENALKSISSGLPTGAIVGIVVGSVLVAGIGGFALVWFVIKKKTWADFVAIFKKKK